MNLSSYVYFDSEAEAKEAIKRLGLNADAITSVSYSGKWLISVYDKDANFLSFLRKSA